MPSVYDLKTKFQSLLRPIVRALARAHVTANAVTLFALLMSIAIGVCIALWPTSRWALAIVPAGLFVRMALNAIDGMLAREHNMKSKLGAVLNEAGDVLSDAAIYFPLIAVPGFAHFGLYPMAAIVVLAGVTELVGVLAQTIGSTRRYDGPMGKSDRAFVFGAITLLLACGIPVGGGSFTWLDLLLFAVIVLLLQTIFNRTRKALKHAGDAK